MAVARGAVAVCDRSADEVQLPQDLLRRGGPEQVLAYLGRYTHRVAIANSRLIAFDQHGVTFNWKDYRIEGFEEPDIEVLHLPQPTI